MTMNQIGSFELATSNIFLLFVSLIIRIYSIKEIKIIIFFNLEKIKIKAHLQNMENKIEYTEMP
jgi:hypothetical protein